MINVKCNVALQVDAPLPASHMTLDALTLTLLSISLTCLSGPSPLCLGAFPSQTAFVTLLLTFTHCELLLILIPSTKHTHIYDVGKYILHSC